MNIFSGAVRQNRNPDKNISSLSIQNQFISILSSAWLLNAGSIPFALYF